MLFDFLFILDDEYGFCLRINGLQIIYQIYVDRYEKLILQSLWWCDEFSHFEF